MLMVSHLSVCRLSILDLRTVFQNPRVAMGATTGDGCTLQRRATGVRRAQGVICMNMQVTQQQAGCLTAAARKRRGIFITLWETSCSPLPLPAGGHVYSLHIKKTH